MPVSLVDPVVQAQGAGIPASPLATMFNSALSGYGRNYPTAQEQAQTNYVNTEAALNQQKLAAPGSLEDRVRQILNPGTIAATQEALRPDPNDIGPEPGVTVQRPIPADVALRQGLPGLVAGLAPLGKISDLGGLTRTVAYAQPGAADTANNTPLGQLSPLDMTSMGAGQSVNETVGGQGRHEVLDTQRELAKIQATHQQGFTMEQMNKNAMIQRIMATQGVDQARAEGIADGFIKTETPQQGGIVISNAASGTITAPGQAPTPGGAPAAGSPIPNNNPGNLRPVGATAGFQSFTTPEAGYVAAKNDLMAKLTGHSNAMGNLPPTLANLISVYSPPSENNTPALIKAAAQRTGLNPNATLGPQHLELLADAIFHQEGHPQPVAAGVAQQPGSSSAPAAPPAPAAPTGSQMPFAKLEDLNFRPDQGVGLGATWSRIPFNGGPARDALTHLDNIKNLMLDVEGALKMTGGNRTSKPQNQLITDALPNSDASLFNPLELAETTFQTGKTADQQVLNKMNEYVQLAPALTRNANDLTKPVEVQKNSKIALDAIDRLISTHASPEYYAAYKQSLGNPVPTNQQVGNALTVPYKSEADAVADAKKGVITRAQLKTILMNQFGEKFGAR